jgi:hypothetical protein
MAAEAEVEKSIEGFVDETLGSDQYHAAKVV